MSDKLNIRSVALAVLDRIEAAGQYSNIALDTAIKRTDVKGADRAFLTTLVYGVIERKITLDYCINKMSSIPPSKIEATVRNILRMGLYQLAFLDRVPDHAAINESVSLAKKRQSGFVNALLRNFARSDRAFPLPDEKEGKARCLSVKYSIGEDICDLFCRIFGDERTEAILSSMNVTPPITIRTNTLRTTRENLLERLLKAGISAEKTTLSDSGIKVLHTAYSDIPGDKEGLWFVQDEASQICAEVLGACPGEAVIDACACPGGKSFSVAMRMENKGILKSFDLHENKLSLVEKNAERLGIDIIETAQRDGKLYDEALYESADRIICDVPCSGLGVIAKKTDIRYKNIDDIARLPALQLAIAQNCVKYLKKGGVLVYSTCTIAPEENEENVKKLLEAFPQLELIPFSAGGRVVESGMMTLYPDTDGTDGFFIAKLKKSE